jgi:predicted nucleic acid-binding protein
VPALWPFELANVLVVAERRKRITAEQREAFVVSLADLGIDVQAQATDLVFREGIDLATKHRLSVYDAVYLELALRLKLPLATQDKQLVRASGEAAVPIFQP